MHPYSSGCIKYVITVPLQRRSECTLAPTYIVSLPGAHFYEWRLASSSLCTNNSHRCVPFSPLAMYRCSVDISTVVFMQTTFNLAVDHHRLM